MQLLSYIYVMVGGAVGSLLRYIAISSITRAAGSDFPYGTLLVNIVGSFLMGLWIGFITSGEQSDNSRDLHLLLAVGVLGGFTTFSTFSLDVFSLLDRAVYIQAGGYILSSVIVSVFALVAGIQIIKAVL